MPNDLYETSIVLKKSPSLGVDISNGFFRFVLLIEGREGIIVENYGEEKIETFMQKPKTIAKNMLRSNSPRSFRISFPEHEVLTFAYHIKKEDPEEMKKEVKRKVEEYMGEKFKGCMYDFTIMQSDESGALVQVFVIPSDIVKTYMDVFKK